MTTMIKFLGFLWALPVTLIGLLALALCGGAVEALKLDLVWVVQPRKMWMWPKRIAAVTLGSVILIRDIKWIHNASGTALTVLFQHEKEHVRQCYILGPFILILYPLASFLSWLLYRKLYRGNYFEIAARLQAGEKP